jgi:uncharacterized protein YjdB
MERCAPWRNVAPSRTTATRIPRGVRIVSLASVIALTVVGCDTVSDPQDEVAWSSPRTVTLAVGQKQQIGVATQSSASAWTSDDARVASVSGTGMTSALAPGHANVVLRRRGRVDTTVVIVHAAVRAVHMVASSAPLTLGGTMGLSFRATDPAGDEITDLRGTTIRWLSRDRDVASVDSLGLVRARSLGSAQVILWIDGVTDSTLVRVTPDVPPGSPVAPIPTPPSSDPPKPPATPTPPPAVPATASVSVTLDSATLAPGHSSTAHAVAKDSKGNVLAGKTAMWTSLNSAVATVSSTGVVTAKAAGSAPIQGVIDGVSGIASVTVLAPAVVTPPSSPSPTTGDLSEPTFDATAATMLFNENFDAYTYNTLHPACGAAEPSHRVIDHSWYYCSQFTTNGGPGVDNGVTVVPGHSGTGVAFHYDGTYQETHGVVLPANGITPTGKKPTVVQYWAQYTADPGYSLTSTDASGNGSAIVQIKNIMLWHDQNRFQIDLHSHQGGCAAYGPSYTMLEAIDQQDVGCNSSQPVGPFFKNYADGQWHRWTIYYKPNSAPGARDGVARAWIDGTLIIRIEASACGAKPTGAWKPWCDLSELDNLYSGNFGVGFIEWGANRTDASGIKFTYAIDDVQWWVLKN